MWISRRSLFIPGGAVVEPSSLATGAESPAVTADLLSASDRAVSAISASDPGFQAAIGALYPGLQDDPIFQKIAPLAILVTHQKGPAVRAHSVAWQITTSTGRYETAQFHYIFPGSPLQGGSLATLRSAPRASLKVGQSRLLTPFFTWTPAYYERNRKPDWSTILNSTAGGFLVSQLAAGAEVRVSLDGVVFADWKIMGPDKYDLKTRLRARRNAERDEGVAVYKLLQSGAPDSVISQTLNSHGSAARSSKLTPVKYWYQQARRYQAQILLKSFASTDRAVFTKALHHLVHSKRTVITRAERPIPGNREIQS